MELLTAIRKVTGVSIEDMRSPLKTKDRLAARVIYSKMSGEKRTAIAREMNKSYNAITYYWKNYDAFYERDEEFKGWADKVKSLI